MVDVMSYEQWMVLTNGGSFSTRGRRLKSVDEALKAYHLAIEAGSSVEAATKKLMTNFAVWQTSKDDWTKSKRNKLGGVTALDRQMKGVQGYQIILSKAEIEALEYVKQAHIETMRLLFKAANIKFKGTGKVDKAELSNGMGSIGTNAQN